MTFFDAGKILAAWPLLILQRYSVLCNKNTPITMGAVIGSDYMVEHWLACYALLSLSGI